ncbi:MAG: caspase family protein [Acidobacteriota bacterium]|nr:caspase family protein [Acidobacteriota bacterium]
MKRKRKSGRARAGARRAFCVGINDYPFGTDDDLNGCVNDATAWAATLKATFGFPKEDIKVVTDAGATKRRVISGLKDLFAGAKSGDVLVFTNSSHGSYLTEKGGDEQEYDEILCPYDIKDNAIVDDEIRELIAGMPKGVRLTVVLDNCFSGTATRAAPGIRTPDNRRRRFLNPKKFGGRVLNDPVSARPRAAFKYPESQMSEIVLTGCTDKEYSYDANINGVYHGAMSYYALQVIQEARGKLTYQQLHDRLRRRITRYPQHPQLEGSAASKRSRLFT